MTSNSKQFTEGQCYRDFRNGDTYEGSTLWMGDFEKIHINAKEARKSRHGKGKYTWADGNVYNGEWIHGYMTGKGTYKFINGDVYDGDFKKNKYNGQGTYTWANGNVYNGNFKDGYKTGKGINKFINGDVYDGEFKYDKYNGKGKYTNKRGSLYNGEFKNDLKHGKGIYKKANGTTFIGKWINDKREGLFKIILDKNFFELKNGKMQPIIVSDNITGYIYFKNDKEQYETLYHPTNNSRVCRIINSKKNSMKFTIFSNDGRQYKHFMISKSKPYSNCTKKRKRSKL
jgi:hypothetical protein